MSPVAKSLGKVAIGHFLYVKMGEMNTLAGYLEKQSRVWFIKLTSGWEQVISIR